ncbi:RNA polymerase sigma factor [Dietzia lutea]|uniref:RNA polymerase subunit sigma-24 n=1 Tax=Dietzia lutea TaxID=546160 RepID=A0A2S1R744_9ACTN|nr:sigma-70 family RNA polymerase sigma factor [Dietzia lutea]AWH92100.1 RNA polymerase subunit sigma-24 [Dietzia lutea]
MTVERPAASDALVRIRHEERARLLAALMSRFGDPDLAEDAAQDAFVAAAESWPRTGVPDRPLAWLMTTATRKAIDRLRRERALTERLARLKVEQDRRRPPAASLSPADPDEIPDDRLELFFACCHPTLKVEEQVVLCLRYLAGLTTVEIAQAFLVPVATMQQRLVRAKKRMRVTRIPVRVPEASELPRRLPGVLAVVYLIYTEGYAATEGTDHIRSELTAEAIRLARIVHRLLPGVGEVTGLLALMLLTQARAPARTDSGGMPVPLGEQDRATWDPLLLAEGLTLAREAASGGPGPYAVQAAIAAVHAEATTFDTTDWAQIAVLYDVLAGIAPGPTVSLGRAVARGRRDGPAVGIAELDALSSDPALRRHHPFHEARAVTLEMLGRSEEAREAWSRAHELALNDAERGYLEKRWWDV